MRAEIKLSLEDLKWKSRAAAGVLVNTGGVRQNGTPKHGHEI